MCHNALLDASFWRLLLDLDRDLMDSLVARGCPCGGRLHRADFRRKPRGPAAAPDGEFGVRFSSCCEREGCRRRATPASVRFLGRKVYLSVIVVLASALRQGPTPRRMRVLREELAVDRRTVQRWARWWREDFRSSRCWRLLRSRLVGIGEEVPRAILDHLGGWAGPEPLRRTLHAVAQPGQSARLPDLVW